MTPLAEALERIQAAYPKQPFGPVAVRVYAEQLRDLDGQMVLAAVNRLLNVSVHMPTIADIRREVCEEALGLPSADEAWDMALNGNSEGIEEVRAAMKAVGGPWTIRNTTSPETLRAQFRQSYEGRRARSIRNAAVGPALTAATIKAAKQEVLTNGNVESLNGRRVLALPESTRMHPRPVMWRLSLRMAGRIVPPPDEAAIQDAIRILEADREGDEDVLYAEAERVLHDA